jgi:tetratricopeptide (TPR) repeat protein
MTGAVWQSAYVAATFALHPLHVESVAWASERKDVLSALFWMLTIAAYIRYVRQKSTLWYLLALFAFAAGLMAKPMLVTLPFVLLLLDYWPLNRIILNSKPYPLSAIRYTLYEKFPFFVLSAVMSIVVFLVQQSAKSVVAIQSITLTARAVNALAAYLMYMEKMIWPARLAVLYPHPVNRLMVSEAAVGLFLLVVITSRIIGLAPDRKYLPVGWLWFLGTLVPVIGLVQVGQQAMADRYTYIPSIGLFIIVAWGAADLTAKWPSQKIALAVSAAVVLMAMLLSTRTQVRYWKNSFTLFEHAIAVTKDNYIMQSNLGSAFRLKGDLDKAIDHYSQALQIQPDLSETHYNLALALQAKGRLDDALTHFRESLRIKPDSPAVLNAAASILVKHPSLKMQDPAEAVRLAERAAELTNLKKPTVLSTLAAAYAAAGQFDKAVKTAQLALDFARTAQNDELTDQILQQLQSYKQGKP